MSTALDAVTPIVRYIVCCRSCAAWANREPAETYCTPSEAAAIAESLGWQGTLCPKCAKGESECLEEYLQQHRAG